MKTNISKIGMSLSLLWIFGFFIRYFVIYVDNSQGLLYCAIGFLGLVFSWIYSKFKELSQESQTQKSRIDGIIKIYTKGEFT